MAALLLNASLSTFMALLCFTNFKTTFLSVFQWKFLYKPSDQWAITVFWDMPKHVNWMFSKLLQDSKQSMAGNKWS